MVKVITYGTFDLLHYGHIRLLERAKALGDYLIVGVTSDDYDKARGKINNQQTLIERVMAVKALGIADEIIAEEYEGQKIDDIRKYDIDIFTVGSDWKGRFDYLKEYCDVVYLDRTEGVSSTEIRSEKNRLRIGLVGDLSSELTSLNKFVREVKNVNGISVVCSISELDNIPVENNYDSLLSLCDAVYIASHPTKHYDQIKQALNKKRHVLCESPITLSGEETNELYKLAELNNCVLMEGIKTAYTTAYERLVLLAKTGKIGQVLSVDSTCTSVKNLGEYDEKELIDNWNTITEWGPPALLPIFHILGTNYKQLRIVSKLFNRNLKFDDFTRLDFIYDDGVATAKIAKGAKSEGELIITGTDGYIYVPAPWWKTDYFEIRYENPAENRRYYYQLEGEGIRYEILAFLRTVERKNNVSEKSRRLSEAISNVMESFYKGDYIELL